MPLLSNEDWYNYEPGAYDDAPRRRRPSPPPLQLDYPPTETTPPERHPNMPAPERRRTPGGHPTPPDVAPPSPMPLPPAGNPGGIVGPTSPNRQSRYGEMEEAKDVYLKGTPGRGRSAIINAIRGALSGLASGQGALPGAITGALGGAIDPQGMREREFNQKIRPQIEERWGYEDQAAQAERQGAFDALNASKTQAEIGEINRRNLPRPERPRPPVNAPGRGLYDPEAGGIIPGTEPLPRQPSPHPVTFQGKTYDYNNPADRARLEQAQAKLPRDRYGRFISRSDERASAPKQAKAEKKYVGISKVREYAQSQGVSVSEAAAKARQDGYTIDHSR